RPAAAIAFARSGLRARHARIRSAFLARLSSIVICNCSQLFCVARFQLCLFCSPHGNDEIPVLRSCAESGINLFLMKRLLLFFIVSAVFPYALFASDSLPFPVSLGGQTAKDGTPFAKIE